MKRYIAPALAPLLVLALGACPPQHNGKGAGKAQQPAAAPQGKVETDPIRMQAAAKVGDSVITVGKLEDEINQQNPFVRMRYSSLEQRKRFLMSLIRFEVMAQEAKKRNLDRDPEVIREVKRAMINRMMLKLRKELVKMKDITDKEIADFYQKNIARYRQPAQVRVSQIVTKTEAEAKKVLTAAGKKPKNPKHFAQLVAVHSTDQATRNRRGDLDYFPKATDKHPKAVVEAAFGIKEMFTLAGPVKLDQGYAVLMLTGAREARNRPLELEKGNIRTKLYNMKQKTTLKEYIKNLHKTAKVKILDENLSKVKIKLRPTAPPPHGH